MYPISKSSEATVVIAYIAEISVVLLLPIDVHPERIARDKIHSIIATDDFLFILLYTPYYNFVYYTKSYTFFGIFLISHTVFLKSVVFFLRSYVILYIK